MAQRHLPVRPDLTQLKQQAKDLLRAIRRGDTGAVAELQEHHPRPVDTGAARLADVQLALARSYGVPSWPRLALACRLIEAIWSDNVPAARALIERHPRLLHENARGTARCNWGPPMTYAANLGRDRIIDLLLALGARDLASAADRATLQGQIGTARKLIALGALPPGARPPAGALLGPAETLNAAGLAFLFELGAQPSPDHAEVAMVLQTYTRNPAGKHACLELLAAKGVDLPDTPVMAVHRGRIDLLAAQLVRDPGLLARTFAHREIYPPALGCHADEAAALHGTPLVGATLLHLCVDFDEVEIARWLLDRGMAADTPAAVDAEGYGGHTALFGCVVSCAARNGRQRDGALARLLLDHGADPNARASLRKMLVTDAGRILHEHRDATPLAWGERFPDPDFVAREAMQVIRARGGGR